MNTKATHFLHELLQNADDSKFETPTPTLCFSYGPGYFRVDCNEEGFTEQNVRAICTLGGSTKIGSDQSTGEKGIGFKSVFKIADGVWISSNNYSFKLDTRQDGELGMICPRWDTFPQSTRPGYTSFYLRLAEHFREKDLVEEITSFDHRLLMFLRTMKRIELRVTRKDGTTWSDGLSREREDGTTTISGTKFVFRYYTTKHTVNCLPPTPNRTAKSQSQIVLGFPMPVPNQLLVPTTQDVYAFLPIRNYGLPVIIQCLLMCYGLMLTMFQFMLQADFITLANREDIQHSSPWNDALRHSTTDAFINAIRVFVEGPMRYRWPRYVPIGAITPPFDATQTEILKALSRLQIVESSSEAMCYASSLAYIPPEFMDNEGLPLTYSESTASRYLSRKYLPGDILVLQTLGVQVLSTEGFLEDLKSLEDCFQNKSADWHSQLALALLPLMTVPKYRQQIKELDLIPLRTGQWTSSTSCTVFFPTNLTGTKIPGGVDLAIVRKAAVKNDSRRQLFEQLGVKNCDTSELYAAIVHMHSAIRS